MNYKLINKSQNKQVKSNMCGDKNAIKYIQFSLKNEEKKTEFN